MPGRVEAVNISRGGPLKRPILEGHVTRHGIIGDVQLDTRFHGGPDRAVVLFSLDIIRLLQAEGHTIAPGSAGENLTVSGLDWAALVPGTRLTINDVTLEITAYTTPCSKLVSLFRKGDFTRISQKVHPGFSRLNARVLQEGTIVAGAAVTVDGRATATESADQCT